MKEVIGNVQGYIKLGIELGISLIAIAVLVQVLFGTSALFGQNVVANLTQLIGELGSNGLVGLFAFGVLLYVFNKRASITG
jgi:hypothetical protein